MKFTNDNRMSSLIMKFSFKKSLVILVGLVGITCAGWFSYDQWQKNEQRKVNWDMVVQDFRDCSLSVQLKRMGFNLSVYDYHGNDMGWRREDSRSSLPDLLTSGYRDEVIKGLDDVWLDPEIQDSISVKQVTPNSINLLSQCDSKIAQGDFQRGLDLAYYYLYLGHPKAEELINKLGEQGVTDVYVLLGHAHRNGLLTSVKDEKMAFAYYLKASNNGSIKGMLNSAELLHSVDFEKSKKYIIAAAEEGSLTAAYMLQDLTDAYRTIDSDKSRTANDIKILYFWNLVFTSLRSVERKEYLDLNLPKSRKSPFIQENNHGYEFDGLPNTPWSGYAWVKNVEPRIVYYYVEETVKENQVKLETELDSDSRIQVQSRVKSWMAEWQERRKLTNKRPALPDGDAEKATPQPANKKFKTVA